MTVSKNALNLPFKNYILRIDIGILSSFSEMSDEVLNADIENILQFTPYGGEVHVIGSLSARDINAQKESKAECIEN